MAIKYTPELNKEIRRIVYNYNRRVQRAMARYPKSKNLPPLIRTADIKNLYENKGQLRQRLNLLQSFNATKLNETSKITADGSRFNTYRYKTGILNSKVALNKINQKLETARRLDREAGRVIPSQRTRALLAEKRTITRAISDNGKITNPKKFLGALRVTERYTDRRSETNQQFYENFFDMLWGDQVYADLDEDLVQSIHDRLEQLSPEQLLEAYNNEPLLSSIVEDYNKYVDTQGYAINDEEEIRSRVRLEMLDEALPEIIEKYSKF